MSSSRFSSSVSTCMFALSLAISRSISWWLFLDKYKYSDSATGNYITNSLSLSLSHTHTYTQTHTHELIVLQVCTTTYTHTTHTPTHTHTHHTHTHTHRNTGTSLLFSCYQNKRNIYMKRETLLDWLIKNEQHLIKHTHMYYLYFILKILNHI